MGTRMVLASVLCTMALATSATAGPVTLRPPPGRFVPFPMTVHTLPNGLRVATVERRGSGMFALYELVGTGSVDEVEPGHSGFAHFFEHMMFRGTEKFPAAARNQLLNALGADDGGYTTDDFTLYHLQGPAEAFPKIMELEGDRFQNLRYTEDVFKTEAQAVLGEYNKNAADPERQAWEALRDLAFDKHTYEHTTLGFLKDIKAMPGEYKYSQTFFERFYTPDNVILFVVGDVTAAQSLALAREHFGDWKKTRAPTALTAEPVQTAPRERTVDWATPVTPRLMMAWRVPSSAADREATAACLVLETYLFSDSSDLAQELVVTDQTVESLSSWWWPHREPHLFPVSLEVKDDKNAAAVRDRVQRSLDDIAAGKIDPARFEAVKSNVRYSALMELNTADHIAHHLAFMAGHSMEPGALDAVLTAVDKTTAADLQELVRTHFGASQRTTVILRHKGAP